MTEDFFTAKTLGKYLGLSQRYIYRMVQRGELPAVRIGGGAERCGEWRFPVKAIENWVEENTTQEKRN